MAIVIITDIIHVTAIMAGATSRIITVIAGMIVAIAGTVVMIRIADIIVPATYGNMQVQSLLNKS